MSGEDAEGAPVLRSETEAVYAALSAGALGAVVGLIISLAFALPVWGWPSTGAVGVLLAAAVAIPTTVVAYLRGRLAPDQAWRRAIPAWREAVQTLSVTIVHVGLAALATAVVYVLISRGFVGLVVPWFWSTIGAAVTTGLVAYIVYLSASRMNTKRMSTLLLLFVAFGTLTAMATTTAPDWWTYHFSYLGTFETFSGFTFNTTLIAGGFLVTTFAVYIQTDMRALVTAGRLRSRRGPTIVAVLLAVMGIMLAFVGIFPVDLHENLHNLSASGMAVMFLAVLASSPWLLRGMPRAFFIATAGFAAALVAVIVLFVVGFFDLTALEVSVFSLVFGWLAIFIRFLAVAGQEE